MLWVLAALLGAAFYDICFCVAMGRGADKAALLYGAALALLCLGGGVWLLLF